MDWKAKAGKECRLENPDRKECGLENPGRERMWTRKPRQGRNVDQRSDAGKECRLAAEANVVAADELAWLTCTISTCLGRRD